MTVIDGPLCELALVQAQLMGVVECGTKDIYRKKQGFSGCQV